MASRAPTTRSTSSIPIRSSVPGPSKAIPVGDTRRALVAAVLRGASVINLSLGMPNPSPAIQAAVNFATSRGAVVVAPAGNDALVAIHQVRNAAKSPKKGWARLRTRLPL